MGQRGQGFYRFGWFARLLLSISDLFVLKQQLGKILRLAIFVLEGVLIDNRISALCWGRAEISLLKLQASEERYRRPDRCVARVSSNSGLHSILLLSVSPMWERMDSGY